jgi:orotate phosphoribosyltransferase
MNKKEFAEYLVAQKIVGFKEEGFKLKSGKISYWYVNFRSSSTSLASLEKLADFVAQFVFEKGIANDTDGILGVPEGATLLGLKVQERLIREQRVADKIFQIRSKPKDHGDPANRYWVNGNVPKRIVLVEDVTTTGGSALEFAQKLIDMGVEVVAVVGVLNRLQKNAEGRTVIEEFANRKIEYANILDTTDVLPVALAEMDTSAAEMVKAKVNKEYEDEYAGGVSPVRL